MGFGLVAQGRGGYYIVENTVGKLLENSIPKKASALRNLDPACGSGSFLIGACQYLGGNIKCGNSLIGPDFYHTGQPTLFDMEETYRINAFGWQAEFPEIFHRKDAKGAKEDGKGGFDAVIGNPPHLGGRDWKPEIRIYELRSSGR